MNKTLALIMLLISAALLGLGLLFLCASAAATEKTAIRFLLSLLLIVLGAAGAAWAGMTWRRLADIEPQRLADRVVEMVRLQGQFETTAAEAVASLSAPAANVPLTDLIPTAGEAEPFEIVFEGKIKIGKITLKR